MKTAHITILAYVTMTLMFGAAVSQVVAPLADNPFTNMFGGGDTSTDNTDTTSNNAGGLDPDTNANPNRQIFAQGFVGGAIPVNSIAKVPFILG